VDEATADRVREVILAIPVGSVLSYGEVAAIAGLPSARLVGSRDDANYAEHGSGSRHKPLEDMGGEPRRPHENDL